VPESKNICPDAEGIKEEVCKKHGVAMDELHRLRRDILNEPRNVTIYLLRSLRGDNLEEIGRGIQYVPIQFGQQGFREDEGEDIRGSPIEKPCRGDQNRLPDESGGDPFTKIA